MNQPSTNSPAARRESQVAGWHLREYAEVASTNFVARELPEWSAVCAETQTSGRGRFQRSWVSDAGGLWLSAVVPVETNSPAWRLLPLVTGVAVCDALQARGVGSLRLRWPNDVLVGERKLAGLLIDQFQPGRAVVGIGVNVTNHPEACDPDLKGHVARLADLLTPAPPLATLAAEILTALKALWLPVQAGDLAGLLPRLEVLWALPRRVMLDLDGAALTGEFAGVDAAGRLQLRDADGHIQAFEPQAVRRLRDLP